MEGVEGGLERRAMRKSANDVTVGWAGLPASAGAGKQQAFTTSRQGRWDERVCRTESVARLRRRSTPCVDMPVSGWTTRLARVLR